MQSVYNWALQSAQLSSSLLQRSVGPLISVFTQLCDDIHRSLWLNYSYSMELFTLGFSSLSFSHRISAAFWSNQWKQTEILVLSAEGITMINLLPSPFREGKSFFPLPLSPDQMRGFNLPATLNMHGNFVLQNILKTIYVFLYFSLLLHRLFL